MTVNKRPQAVDDLWDYARYLARRAGKSLAYRFLDAADSTLEDLAALPGLGSLIDSMDLPTKNLRLYPIRGFRNHILVYLELKDGGVDLVCVIHGRRNLKRHLRKLT